MLACLFSHYFSVFIMRCVTLLVVFLIALTVAQEYSMGTKEQPKADLPVDENLIIQNIVFPYYVFYVSLFPMIVPKRL